MSTWWARKGGRPVWVPVGGHSHSQSGGRLLGPGDAVLAEVEPDVAVVLRLGVNLRVELLEPRDELRRLLHSRLARLRGLAERRLLQRVILRHPRPALLR